MERFWDPSVARTRVKLCEFESLDAAYPAAVWQGADALGFHIFKPRPHDVGLAARPEGAELRAPQGEELRASQGEEFKVSLFEGIFRHLPAGTTQRCLLTDLDADHLLQRVLPRLAVDCIQLYPDWAPDELKAFSAGLRELERASPRPRVKLLKVMSARPEENVVDDAAFVARYQPLVDGFLLDSARIGGTGKAADWGHCADVVQLTKLPVFLAGGLTADNVADAIARVRPFGVNVETGVSDRVPGGPLIKNLEKCQRFLNAVRAADRALGRS